MSGYSRRTLLTMASGLALAGMTTTPRWLNYKPRFVSYPFTLGVASGDPFPNGAVIWTRLAPNPMDADATGHDPVPVRWEVAADDSFRRIIKKGGAVAYHANAHTLHVAVDGLNPARPYFYRFMAGDEVSPSGRLVTAPDVLAPVDRLRFAVASCQHYEAGYFNAYRDMIDSDVSLIVHLGDYIYENSWNGPVRRVPVADARSLADYRALHAVYKTDPDLQAAHAFAPFVVTWDDHEVANDYAAEFDEHYEPPERFLKRRAAAYKAYYEHMPLRATATPNGANMRLYQRLYFGDMLELNMLDTRQYRTDHPCQTPQEGGWQLIDGSCADRFDPERTILGRQQEGRFLHPRFGFGSLGCRWNVMAQGMLFSKHDFRVGDEEAIGSEYWDGYVESRNRVIRRVGQGDIRNPVCIGGDVHASYVCDVKEDFDKPDSRTVMTEFVTTSISSPNSYWQENRKALGENPHIKHYTGQYRGYTRITLTQEQLRADLRVADTVLRRQTTVRTDKSFIVEDGIAGAKEV